MASEKKSAMKKQYQSAKSRGPRSSIFLDSIRPVAKRVGLKIRDFFEKLGISKFVEMKGPIYPDLMCEFYASLHDTTHSSSKLSVVFYVVCRQKIIVSNEILKEIFGLRCKGYVCDRTVLDNEYESRVSDIYILEFLSSKSVIDITNDVFENNDFSVEIHMLLVALTRCLMLKINTQHKLVGVNKQVVYRVFKEEEVNFSAIVRNWMMAKGDLFHSEKYASQARKAGMRFGCILTEVFKLHKVDLQGGVSIPVSKGHEICDSTLKAMHYVETLNQEWVLFSYLNEDDRVHRKTHMPTTVEWIMRRGPETLREYLCSSPEIKGKKENECRSY